MERTDRPVALIAALEEEAHVLSQRLAPAAIPAPHLSMWVGAIEALPVVLAVSGVGKVSAALATQFVCDTYRPRGVITFGLAGATDSDSQTGRVIVASGAVQHDMDARPLTDARGVIPGLGTAMFAADATMSEHLLRATELVVENPAIVTSGLVLTGDQIVTSRAVRDGRLRDFPHGLCFDMETAAIAQVAHQNGIPWAAVRVTSDAADETFNLDAVLGFGVKTAAGLFDEIFRAFLKISRRV